ECGREQGQEFSQHRLMGDERYAEIAFCHLTDIGQELLPERAVETHFVQQLRVPDRVDATLAPAHFDRIAGYQVDEQERQEDDPEKGGDHQAYAGQQEAQHRGATRNKEGRRELHPRRRASSKSYPLRSTPSKMWVPKG